MEQFLEALKRYIAEYPPNFGDGESVLTMLYECHNENNPYDNEQIRADFNELYQQMNGMPLREMDQLYQASAESHERDPAEIGDGFKELEEFLCNLPPAGYLTSVVGDFNSPTERK